MSTGVSPVSALLSRAAARYAFPMSGSDPLVPLAALEGAYQTIFELARGGMATIHLARRVGGDSEQLVVLKRPTREVMDSPEAIRRFFDETRHAALIRHPNVVRLHQAARDDEGPFLVLDYIEGASLDEFVDRAALRAQKLPPPVVLRIALDVLNGLSAVHSEVDASGAPLNLLHRDVTPQNILVGSDGVARLADFGIAKSTVASVITDRRYIHGKLLYSPPEHLSRGVVGPPLDIYGLGLTLWMALTGSEPWPETSEAQLVTWIYQGGVPRLGAAGLRVAPLIEDLVARACERDPTKRFASAFDMASAIEEMGRETGWVATHADVARFLDALIGVDLSRRRTRIASVIATLSTRASSSKDQ